MEDKSGFKNTIIAVILSAIVLFTWDYFLGPKTVQHSAKAISAGGTAGSSESDKKTEDTPLSDSLNIPALEVSSPKLSRQTVLTESRRLQIVTPSLSGSFNLKEGRFDDLLLLKHKQEAVKNSPSVVLLSPKNTENSYYATFGYNSDGKPLLHEGVNGEIWKIVEGETLTPKTPVTLEYIGDKVTVRRKISVDENYMFAIEDQVANQSDQPVSLSPYGIVKREFSGPVPVSEHVVHTGFVARADGEIIERSATDVQKIGSEKFISSGGWAGWTDKYWMTALIPPQNAKLEMRVLDVPGLGADGKQIDYVTKAVIVNPSEIFTFKQDFFAGAKSVEVIEAYRDNLKIEGFEYTVDWGWFWYFTKPIFHFLQMIQNVVGNYGVSILILTFFMKLLFFPLANKSYKAMSKMKALQPEMEKIRAKHTADPVKQQQALIELYKKEKINPVAGCWPLLLQIPVFYALYKVLNVALDLRHAPFFGWIQDLSAKDPSNLFNLFGLLPFTPPDFLHVGILPLLMGVTMWLQQKMNPAPPDPTQAKIMGFFPIIFTFILAPFAAGLVIYWTFSNILSVLQQGLIMKKAGVPIQLHFKSGSAGDVGNDNKKLKDQR